MKHRLFWAVFVVFLSTLAASEITAQTTFTVNTADDLDDGACDAMHCSLREAIRAANTTAGVDTIEFDIAGAGPHTIQPLSSLPSITETLGIDGYSQPGSAPATSSSVADLRIELNGSNTLGSGLFISADFCVVRGLVINRFPFSGIVVNGDDNLILGNHIGTDVTGTFSQGNATGINILGDKNRVGGKKHAVRNIVSGNTGDGIFINNSSNNKIQGNFIGTAATGSAVLGNGRDGVHISSPGVGNLIGGSANAARNVISGNLNGIFILGPSAGTSSRNVVVGNLIGTDRNGTVDLGNTLDGITISFAHDNTVRKNVISGNNRDGIHIEWCDGNILRRNLIGTKINGTNNLGNNAGGVVIVYGSNNKIGGKGSAAGNTIAFNSDGVVLVTSPGITVTGNLILRNSIFANERLGIDLTTGGVPGAAGVTPNDLGDNDIGVNELQNFPDVSLATTNGSNISISASLNSTPLTTFRIEYFANAVCDPDRSGTSAGTHGEGRQFIGSVNVRTDSSGDARGTVTYNVPVPAGAFVTTTATNPKNSTSEFSECEQVLFMPAPQEQGAQLLNDEQIVSPQRYSLNQNYPNPFNPSTTITFAMPDAGYVELKIYDSLGRVVRTLAQENKSAGEYSVVWDGKDEFGGQVASGHYFYQFRAGDFQSIQKMILIK